jgi:hypothetical protein
MIALALLLACTPPDSSVPDDTDIVGVDTDPIDSDPPDTDQVGEVVELTPGVFVDRASPTWFDVASQSTVCWLVIDPGSSAVIVDLLGMDNGTLHPYITGLRLPDDAQITEFDSNIDLSDGVLYFGRFQAVTALELETGRWWPTRQMYGTQFASFGGHYSDGLSTWQTWDDIGGPPHTDLPGAGAWRVASDGDALYISDDCGLRRVRGSDDLPECYKLPRGPAQGYIAADVVGLHSVVMWRKDVTWWVSKLDGNGRVLAEYELPRAYFQKTRGVACQPGPL